MYYISTLGSGDPKYGSYAWVVNTDDGERQLLKYDEIAELNKTNPVKGFGGNGNMAEFSLEHYCNQRMKRDKEQGIDSIYVYEQDAHAKYKGIVLRYCNLNGNSSYEVLDGTEYIFDKAFSAGPECINFVDYTVKLPKSCSVIGDGAFRNTAIREIDLGNATHIGIAAFEGCFKLDKVTIAGGRTDSDFEKCEVYIERSAFYNCKSLQEVEITCMATVSESAFAKCERLTTVNFGGPTWLSHRVFKDCSALWLITGDKIMEMGVQTFANCESLNNIDLSGMQYVNLRDSEPPDFFSDCYSLEKVIWSKHVPFGHYRAFRFCDKLKELHNIAKFSDDIPYNDICLPSKITFFHTNMFTLEAFFKKYSENAEYTWVVDEKETKKLFDKYNDDIAAYSFVEQPKSSAQHVTVDYVLPADDTEGKKEITFLFD